MQEAIQDTKRMTSITQFKGTGVWLDKKDLEEKYKNKPDQLASVLKYGKAWEHPARKCTLWEDIEYQSVTLDEEEHTRTQKRNVEFAHRPVSKKPKTEGDGEAGDAEEVEGEKLKGGQKKRLETLLTKLQAARYKLSDAKDNATKPEMKEYMPPYSVPGATKIIESIKQVEEQVNNALLKGYGEFGNLMELMKQKQDSANHAAERIDGQIIEATSLLEIGEGLGL